MRRTQRLIGLGLAIAMVVLVTIVLIVFAATRPKPGVLADTVRVRWVGYTNNPAGARMGVFTITNPSPIAIDVGRWHEVQVETNGNWAPAGMARISKMTIKPGAAAQVEINVPSSGPWRLWINYADHTGFGADFVLALQNLGLPVRFRNQTYSALSDVITP